MVYAELLSGGNGTRFGNKVIPKQYIVIKGKPIFIYTLETLAKNEKIDKIIVCCNKDWEDFVRKEIKKHIKEIDKIELAYSGDTRNETMYTGCKYIRDKYKIKEEDIILTIDAVRMFVTNRIINDNIEMAKKYSAVGTFFPVVDNVMESSNGTCIEKMPNRSFMYQVQAPQTFNLKKLIKYYESLTEEEKTSITDCSKIFMLRNETVHMVKGEYYNFKITYNQDLSIAEKYIENMTKK